MIYSSKDFQTQSTSNSRFPFLQNTSQNSYETLKSQFMSIPQGPAPSEPFFSQSVIPIMMPQSFMNQQQSQQIMMMQHAQIQQSVPAQFNCYNEYCQLNSQNPAKSQEKAKFLDQARSMGLNIVCVNCGKHDFKQIIDKVKQDGEIFLFVNSFKIGKSLSGSSSLSDNSVSNTTIPTEGTENNNQQSQNFPSLTSANIPSFTSIAAGISSPSPQQQQMSNPNSTNLSTQVSVQSGNFLNFMKPPYSLFPSNDQLMKECNQKNTSIPMNFLTNPSQQPFGMPILFNNQAENFQKTAFIPQNQQFVLHQLMQQQLGNQVFASKKNTLQQQQIPVISSTSEPQKEALPKQRHGLFKRALTRKLISHSKEFGVKVEGGQEECSSSGRESHNNIQTSPEEDNSSDSFSGECEKKECQAPLSGGAQFNADELEKQNKIKERRKTNNFGHIYTWLKNQIRLYFGDRELYEKIQSYFTRVNKYNEVVTDESSSKWQFFLFQIKDNCQLKSFLKEKIKSEHFREYIKTRKGKDQKVFYEFRIGVIYGIDHPELSNQPKNCLLMAKKDPEYNSINFGW